MPAQLRAVRSMSSWFEAFATAARLAEPGILQLHTEKLAVALQEVEKTGSCISGVARCMFEQKLKQATAAQAVQRLASGDLLLVDTKALDEAINEAKLVEVDSGMLRASEERGRDAMLAQMDSALVEAVGLVGARSISLVNCKLLHEIPVGQLADTLSQARKAGTSSEFLLPLEAKLRDAAMEQARQLIDQDLLDMPVDELELLLQHAAKAGTPPRLLGPLIEELERARAAQKTTLLASEQDLLEIATVELEEALKVARRLDVPPHIVYPCDEKWRKAAKAQLEQAASPKLLVSIQLPELEACMDQAHRAGLTELVQECKTKMAKAKGAHEIYSLTRRSNRSGIAWGDAANARQTQKTQSVEATS